jgi:hypothetical protein
MSSSTSDQSTSVAHLSGPRFASGWFPGILRIELGSCESRPVQDCLNGCFGWDFQVGSKSNRIRKNRVLNPVGYGNLPAHIIESSPTTTPSKRCRFESLCRIGEPCVITYHRRLALSAGKRESCASATDSGWVPTSTGWMPPFAHSSCPTTQFELILSQEPPRRLLG